MSLIVFPEALSTSVIVFLLMASAVTSMITATLGAGGGVQIERSVQQRHLEEPQERDAEGEEGLLRVAAGLRREASRAVELLPRALGGSGSTMEHKSPLPRKPHFRVFNAHPFMRGRAFKCLAVRREPIKKRGGSRDR